MPTRKITQKDRTRMADEIARFADNVRALGEKLRSGEMDEFLEITKTVKQWTPHAGKCYRKRYRRRR